MTQPSSSRALVVVLGASGFVGSAVTTALARCPVRLRAVARRPSVVPAGQAETEVRTADLTDQSQLSDVVAGADAVINLVKHDGGWRAAEEESTSRLTNVDVMTSLVESLRGGDRDGRPPVVLFSGTISQIGVPPDHPIDGTEPDEPITAYDRQKLAAEQVLKKATADGVVRGASLRLPTIFGHGRTPESADHGVVATMVRRALAGQELTMWHDGTVEREFIYAPDVADAFLAALDHADDLAGGHWPLGSDRSEPLGDVFREIAERVAAHTGGPAVPVVSIDPPAHAPVTDFKSVRVDSSRFRAITGWKPRVPLGEAVRNTIAALA
ncbi:NAD-dependent epimerase/dehydratase family protein [Halostreptopolyspora alba]|uniref:NAD(P)-dependent oxidoreductase n=1 Tax=Halostreptopolyspora alba TaxID=2487137 RepID=A0A3N0EFL5_9ACTN|nr:NAD(P)-dependent oxidoreductase [Nocardiopsaceae bacterium YIM 96095]